MHIYLTINKITNDIYIGKTIKSFESNYYGSGLVIKHSIKKYGIENFHKLLLFETNSEKLLNKAEIYFIDYFRRKYIDGKVLNISDGGEGGPLFKGKKHTKESKEKISNSLKKYYNKTNCNDTKI